MALLVWNRGFREGNAGTTVGKGWCSLVTRDAATVLRSECGARCTDGHGARPAPRWSTRRPPAPTGSRRSCRTPRSRRSAAADSSPGSARRPAGARVVRECRRRRAPTVVRRGVPRAVLVHRQRDRHHRPHVADSADAARLVVGIALGVAGALIQGHTRNPLADAGLLGLNAVRPSSSSSRSTHSAHRAEPVPVVRFRGSALASITVFGLSSIGNGKASPLSLALAGAAVAFFLQAGPTPSSSSIDHARRLPLLGRGAIPEST
ncbi:iron chelate uptake ABC transporter family permease subunit [Rhodococcus hoagii]|nr:iron chelate uptake ABC transporter family permease subunit [Prescottella equi]